MNQIYASCTDTYIHIDSTVNFILNGCTAPVLVSMDVIRSSADPFDPSEVGKTEIAVDGSPYLASFEEEGMYLIFCDPSFKSLATCITLTSDELLLAGPTPEEVVPTLGQWSLIILLLSFMVVGLVSIKNLSYIRSNRHFN